MSVEVTSRSWYILFGHSQILTKKTLDEKKSRQGIGRLSLTKIHLPQENLQTISLSSSAFLVVHLSKDQIAKIHSADVLLIEPLFSSHRGVSQNRGPHKRAERYRPPPSTLVVCHTFLSVTPMTHTFWERPSVLVLYLVHTLHYQLLLFFLSSSRSSC